MKNGLILLLLVLASFLAGCASATKPQITASHSADKLYPPTTHTEIERLKEFPKKPYIIVGEITITNNENCGEPNDCKSEFDRQARTMGADAAVVTFECQGGAPCMYLTNMDEQGRGILMIRDDTTLRAVLIRYKHE